MCYDRFNDLYPAKDPRNSRALHRPSKNAARSKVRKEPFSNEAPVFPVVLPPVHTLQTQQPFQAPATDPNTLGASSPEPVE